MALSKNFSLIHKIRSIFVLAGALGADHIVVLEEVYTLSAKYGVMVGGSQGICDILLISDAIATVLGLTVNSIACDTDDRLLLHQRDIVAASPISSGHGRRYIVRPCVSGVNAVILINERLMAMFLSTKGTGQVFCAIHDTATLVVQAQDARHHICAAFSTFERGSDFFLIADAACLASLTCRKTSGNECLLFHSGL